MVKIVKSATGGKRPSQEAVVEPRKSLEPIQGTVSPSPSPSPSQSPSPSNPSTSSRESTCSTCGGKSHTIIQIHVPKNFNRGKAGVIDIRENDLPSIRGDPDDSLRRFREEHKGKVMACSIFCFILWLVLFVIIPIILIALGAVYYNKCPVGHNIPLVAIIGGVIVLVITLPAFLIPCIKNEKVRLVFAVINGFMLLLLFIWIIAAAIIIYSIHPKMTTDSHLKGADNYCHPALYWFLFIYVTFLLAIVMFFFLLCLCLCCLFLCLLGIASTAPGLREGNVERAKSQPEVEAKKEAV